MQTVAEWLKNPQPVMWFHAIDAFKHILKGDTKETWFKDKAASSHHDYLQIVREAMAEHRVFDRGFQEIVERTEFTGRRSKPVKDDCGDLDIGLFLDGDQDCFYDYPKAEVPQYRGVTIAFDITVCYGERDQTYMIDRHREAYRLAVQHEADGIPCRVIGVLGVCDIPELEDAPCRGKMKVFFIVKDYTDPIFPGIWAAFKSNISTNAVWNSTSDYIIGTKCPGNGTRDYTRISDFIEDDEVVVLQPASMLMA